MNLEKIGNFIASSRKKQNLTQEQLAEKLGITKNAVSKWERGNGMPDVSLLAGICKVLGVSAGALIGVEESVVENGNITADREIKNNNNTKDNNKYLNFLFNLSPCFPHFFHIVLISCGYNVEKMWK